MEQPTLILLTLGGLFLAGLVTDLIGRHTPLPRVTLLLILGFVSGPSVLDLLPDFREQWFPVVTDMALVMIGFLLGQKMTVGALREHGRDVLVVSVSEVAITSALMLAVLLLLGVDLTVALLLAGIAPASAPAATVDVVHELNADGPFSRTLLGVVAIDDAWGLLIFSFLLAAAGAVQGQGAVADVLLGGLWEIGGAVALGAALGVPMAYLTGRLKPGEPTQAEAYGMVFLCGGVAIWLEVSYILAAMVLGSVVANLARHHRRLFSAIEGIEWPFMILFFVLAGASLHVDSLLTAGGLAAAYIVLRTAGLMGGAWLSGHFTEATPVMQRWMGAALLPQAGVALGMALLATQHFPALRDVVLPVVIGSTVVFELAGPVVTRHALVAVGEANAGDDAREASS